MINIPVHYFLVDQGDEGHLYHMGIQGKSKDLILGYLYQYSKDVRYVKTKDKAHKSEKGNRKIPFGTIISCQHKTDKCNTFSDYRTSTKDKRLVLSECTKAQDTCRLVEILNGNEWEPTEFKYLQVGDRFRMFDDDEPVIDACGQTIFTAISDAYMNSQKIWQINVEESDEI